RVAVMRNGVIEQIGAPREIYDRPRSAFVASFLGASNFVAGIVVAREASAIVVETPAGRVAAHGDRPIADRVRIAVRPERVRMERPGGEGLPAQIRDIVYRGPVTHFYLDSAAGPLIAYRQDARAGEFAIGEAVRCTWHPDSAVVLDEAQS
ncbi:MAG TPA: TOBE domain-containing protein, partial [Casimicrobiaceae bacterium]